MTKAEEKLWKELRNKKMGVKFYRQKIIGRYIVDFYCHIKNLVIEIDGDTHYLGNGQEKDFARDKHLERMGLKVIRFTNSEVLKNIDAVIKRIWVELGNEL